MTRRERWIAFRDAIDRSPPLTDAELDALLARLDAEPDPWLRRASIVHLVRIELLTDEQLRAVAAKLGGKFATFIERRLEPARSR